MVTPKLRRFAGQCGTSWIALWLSFSACSQTPALSKPPVYAPFELRQGGSSQTLEARVEQPMIYAVNIFFDLYEERRWYEFWEKSENLQEEKKFSAALGVDTVSRNGVRTQLGVPAVFRVRIFKGAGEHPVFEQTIEHPETNFTTRGRYATLGTHSLQPGDYRVSVDYLSGAAELAALKARISLARAHHGK